VPAASREEKRHASPGLHPADYDDSMDGAPTSKRVRFKPSAAGPARTRPAAASTPSSSRVATPPRGQEDEEEVRIVMSLVGRLSIEWQT
jgi:hypothetical protein